MKRAILFNAFLLLTATAIAVADGALDVSTGFFGGTVPNATTFASPVVFTGDNASGTGTLRIRPPDEDTQIVLCEASNNAATEVCSALQHYNASTTVAGFNFTANGYVDSSFTQTRNNTAFGSVVINGSTSSTAANNFLVMNAYGTGGAIAGNAGLVVSGAATSTFITGSLGTVTNDFRGPILNGGSATCGGYNAGWECHNDDVFFYSSAGNISTMGTAASAIPGVIFYNSAAIQTGFVGYGYGGAADADYAQRVLLRSTVDLISINRIDDVAAGATHTEWRDNSGATGVLLMDVLGNGTVRPLLYGSQSNCSDGAGAAACSAAPAGSVVIDDGATTVVVSTTAVTANSQILLTYDSSLGTKLGVTCNTNIVQPTVSARTAATSFTITISADPATANPACISYFIVN